MTNHFPQKQHMDIDSSNPAGNVQEGTQYALSSYQSFINMVELKILLSTR